MSSFSEGGDVDLERTHHANKRGLPFMDQRTLLRGERMYSQTFIGREIFAAVWALVVLDAASAADRIQFPFDDELRNFVSRRRGAIDSLWGEIQRFACIEDDVMWIPEDDAPWSGAPDKYPDPESLKAELALSDPAIERFHDASAFERLTLDQSSLQVALAGQLARLLGGLLSSRWAFSINGGRKNGAESPEQLYNGLVDVFSRLTPVLRATMANDEPKSLIRTAYRTWRRTLGADLDDAAVVAEYRDFLKRWARYMDEREEGLDEQA